MRLVNYAADFDSNGIVDALDVGAWKSHFGSNGTRSAGDANGDGVIEGADFLIWQQQLGACQSACALPWRILP
jgi:hypothetical protein